MSQIRMLRTLTARDMPLHSLKHTLLEAIGGDSDSNLAANPTKWVTNIRISALISFKPTWVVRGFAIGLGRKGRLRAVFSFLH